MTGYTLFQQVASGAGLLSLALLLVRVLLILEREFSVDDKIMQDPLAFAADSTLTYQRFKENNWRAFAALWAAMRFRLFYGQFRPLLSYSHGVHVVLVLLVAEIAAYWAAASSKDGPISVGGTAGLATCLNLAWILLIERAKNLKKMVDNLKVS